MSPKDRHLDTYNLKINVCELSQAAKLMSYFRMLSSGELLTTITRVDGGGWDMNVTLRADRNYFVATRVSTTVIPQESSPTKCDGEDWMYCKED